MDSAIESLMKAFPDREARLKRMEARYNKEGQQISNQEWANQTDEQRVVKQERLGEFFLSTVCLGIDHDFFLYRTPVIFETMIFCRNNQDHPLHCYQDRYCHQEQALAGHEKAKKLILNYESGSLIE